MPYGLSGTKFLNELLTGQVIVQGWTSDSMAHGNGSKIDMEMTLFAASKGDFKR